MSDFGLSLAVGLGTRWLLSMFQPKEKVQKLDASARKPPSSEYAKAITQIEIGVQRIGTTYVWGKDLQESYVRPKRTGKGGGRKKKELVYLANLQCLIAFTGKDRYCTLRKIWFSGKLVYDQSDYIADGIPVTTTITNLQNQRGKDVDGTKLSDVMKNKLQPYIRFYPGGGGNSVDATLSSELGVNASSYQNFCYLVLHDFNVTEKYGNSFPQIEVEVQVKHHGDYITAHRSLDPLSYGMKLIDNDNFCLYNSELNQNVTGASLPNDGTDLASILNTRSIISGCSLKVAESSLATSPPLFQLAPDSQYPDEIRTVAMNNLGVRETGSEVISTIQSVSRDAVELPTKVKIDFSNPIKSFDRSTVQVDSGVDRDLGIVTESIGSNLVLVPDVATRFATQLLRRVLIRRDEYQISAIAGLYSDYLPGALVAIPGEGTFVVTKVNIGNNLVSEVFLRRSENVPFTLPAQPEPLIPYYPVFGNSPIVATDCNTHVIVPTDNPNGIYVYAKSTSEITETNTVSESLDGINFSPITSVSTSSQAGNTSAQVINPTATHTVPDEETRLTVVLNSGSKKMSPVPEIGWLNHERIALWGDELIAWRDAQLIAPDTYLVKGLQRGIRGTESFMGTHSVGDRFVIMRSEDSEILRVPHTDAQIGTTTKTIRADEDDTDNFTQLVYSPTSIISRKPWSPGHLTAQEEGSTLKISWRYRAKYQSGWEMGVDTLDQNTGMVTIILGGFTVFSQLVSGSEFIYTADMLEQHRAEYGIISGATYNISVRQKSLNPYVGLGYESIISGTMPDLFSDENPFRMGDNDTIGDDTFVGN